MWYNTIIENKQIALRGTLCCVRESERTDKWVS